MAGIPNFVLVAASLALVAACGDSEPATFTADTTTTTAGTTTTEADAASTSSPTQDPVDAAVAAMAAFWADAVSGMPWWPGLDNELADYAVDTAVALCSDIDTMTEPTAQRLADGLSTAYDLHVGFFTDAGMEPSEATFGARTFVEMIAGPGTLELCRHNSPLLAAAVLLWLADLG